MGDARSRGWGPGWPADRRRDMARVVWGDVGVWVHNAIAPIVADLIRRTEAMGYNVRGDWSWGYANRAIAGTRTPSNHSWGLAVDLNAPANAVGPTLRTDLPPEIVALWRDHGFRWGGAYAGVKDPMHFEFLGTPADAADVRARIGARTLDSRPPPAPTQEGRLVVNAPPVAILPAPDGYWEVTADGGVFTFGAARFHGSMGGARLNAPVVGGAVPLFDGGGYWLCAADGGVFAFGNARGDLGSLGSIRLNAPVIGMAAHGASGYWLVARDGGVFAFGDAPFRGALVYAET
jgi:hypothetical protein